MMMTQHILLLCIIIGCIISIYILYKIMNSNVNESFTSHNSIGSSSSIVDGTYYIKMVNGKYLNYANGDLQPLDGKNHPTSIFLIKNGIIFTNDGRYDIFIGNALEVLTPHYAWGISSTNKFSPLIYNGNDNTITNFEKTIVLGNDGMCFHTKDHPNYPIGKFTLEQAIM